MARIGVGVWFGGALITLLYYLVCLHAAPQIVTKGLKLLKKSNFFFINKVITRCLSMFSPV